VPPRTPAEEVIANVWTEVLGIERIGIHENFFELGGHSLLATRVISRLREAFTIDLPVRRMFEAPTVAGLAGHVEAARRTTSPAAVPPLRALARSGAMPMSFAQQRLWFLDQLEPGGWSYNIPGAVRLRGRLNVEALAWSLTEVVRRHEALRTVFPAGAGEARQLVTPAAPVPLAVEDLGGLAAAEREPEVRRRAVAAARRPFDLARGPLFRAQVLRLDDEEHVLLVEMHHIVSDGWSLGVLVTELGTLSPPSWRGNRRRCRSRRSSTPISRSGNASYSRASWGPDNASTGRGSSEGVRRCSACRSIIHGRRCRRSRAPCT
jgi:acyl carrier protein